MLLLSCSSSRFMAGISRQAGYRLRPPGASASFNSRAMRLPALAT
jgi:hypothetical protein